MIVILTPISKPELPINKTVKLKPKMSLYDEKDLEDATVSPVKKERLKKVEKERLRQTLRNSLPVLTKQDIRKYRLPYHQAILADLEEAGLINTAEFIRQLIELQTQNRKKHDPGSVDWIRPQLKDSKPNLDFIVKSLTAAEKAHKGKRFAVEWEELLRLAAHYAFGAEDWWWLGEQLLYQCVSMEYPGTFDKQEAIAYFIIGKYLVENGTKVDAGKFYLDLAREMSEGKSWSCAKILNKKQDVIYIESCRLLYSALIDEAQSLLRSDPERTIDICNVARRRALEACDHAGEAEALLIRARCELLLNKSADAIATTTKVLNRMTRRKLVDKVCECKTTLALANLQHGKSDECLVHLQDLKIIAQKNNLPFFVAQAYRFTGEVYLKRKKPYEATPYMMMAFYMYHQVKDLHRREKTRTWSAISAGEELFPAFINLVQKCDNTEEGKENLMKLILWIDEKEHFWTQESKFCFSYNSLRERIIEE